MCEQGAETGTIIAVYIAMIKALRHLDPSDALLEVTTTTSAYYVMYQLHVRQCLISLCSTQHKLVPATVQSSEILVILSLQ
jgi:hypothetical protein